MRLTAESHPGALQRYRGLDRAGFSDVPCGARLPDDGRRCTRPRGHAGPHAVHDVLRRVRAVWDTGRGVTRPEPKRPSRPRRRRRRRPPGLPSRRPEALLAAPLERLRRIVADVEQLALLILFVAFVGFAVHWLVLLLG